MEVVTTLRCMAVSSVQRRRSLTRVYGTLGKPWGAERPRFPHQLRQKNVRHEYSHVNTAPLKSFLLHGERARAEGDVVEGCGPVTVRTSRSVRGRIFRCVSRHNKGHCAVLNPRYKLTT